MLARKALNVFMAGSYQQCSNVCRVMRFTFQQVRLVLLKDDQILQLSRSEDLFRRGMCRDRLMSRLLAAFRYIIGGLIEPRALAHGRLCNFHDLLERRDFSISKF